MADVMTCEGQTASFMRIMEQWVIPESIHTQNT